MTWDDDYRALVESARDAMRELLDASEHDAWIGLRSSYGTVRDALKRDDEARERDEQRQRAAEDDAKRVRRAARYAAADGVWRSLTREQREAVLFDVLGDDRLLIRELMVRLNERLLTPECDGVRPVHQGNVRALVMRMTRDGQLDRTPERFQRGSKTRYRYSRRLKLDGPIADLERAFHDDEREA